MDECILILILIIIIACVLIFYFPSQTAVVGGALTLLKPNKNQRMWLESNSKIVVDGNNFIHSLLKTKYTVLDFEQKLKDASAMLSLAFPTHDVHIVVKNPSEERTRAFNKIKKERMDNLPKMSTGLRIPYFRELVRLSEQFPSITYHLAYDKEKTVSQHHMKGRDDFLTVYLAKDHYMISNDRYRDYKQFANIKPFTHYSVKNGNTLPKERLKPNILYQSMDKPDITNHLIYKIIPKKSTMDNGSIYLTDESVFGCVFIKEI